MALRGKTRPRIRMMGSQRGWPEPSRNGLGQANMTIGARYVPYSNLWGEISTTIGAKPKLDFKVFRNLSEGSYWTINSSIIKLLLSIENLLSFIIF